MQKIISNTVSHAPLDPDIEDDLSIEFSMDPYYCDSGKSIPYTCIIIAYASTAQHDIKHPKYMYYSIIG